MTLPRSRWFWGTAVIVWGITLNALVLTTLDDWRWTTNGRKVSAMITAEHDANDGLQQYDLVYDEVTAAHAELSESLDIGDVVTVFVNPADATRVQTRHDAILGVVVMPPITAAVALAPVFVVVWLVRQRKRVTQELS